LASKRRLEYSVRNPSGYGADDVIEMTPRGASGRWSLKRPFFRLRRSRPNRRAVSAAELPNDSTRVPTAVSIRPSTFGNKGAGFLRSKNSSEADATLYDANEERRRDDAIAARLGIVPEALRGLEVAATALVATARLMVHGEQPSEARALRSLRTGLWVGVGGQTVWYLRYASRAA